MDNSTNTFKRWESAIKAGNNSFELSQPLIAISHYQNAINIAYQLYQCHFDTTATLAALITSHHNLAEVFASEKALKLAERELTTIYKFIQNQIESITTDSDQLEALLWGMGRSRSMLLSFLKSNKTDKQIAVSICNTRKLSESIMN